MDHLDRVSIATIASLLTYVSGRITRFFFRKVIFIMFRGGLQVFWINFYALNVSLKQKYTLCIMPKVNPSHSVSRDFARCMQ